MSLFGMFRKKEDEPPNWPEIAGRIAGLLWTLLSTEPKRLASPYARIVLRNDWSVFLAEDKRDPKYILGWGDVTYVFLRENQSALSQWVEELKSNLSPPFQLIATEEYAKSLSQVLMQSVTAS